MACPNEGCILLAGHTQPCQTDDPATWPTPEEEAKED